MKKEVKNRTFDVQKDEMVCTKISNRAARGNKLKRCRVQQAKKQQQQRAKS
jgi:hypothetical protein